MKTFLIAFFLLLSFTLSAALPQMTVHTHEVNGGHDHSGHDHRHQPGDDIQDSDKQANKDLKTHIHDGQIHEYVSMERLTSKAHEKAVMPPLALVSIPVSENIKPPLEPPAYL